MRISALLPTGIARSISAIMAISVAAGIIGCSPRHPHPPLVGGGGQSERASSEEPLYPWHQRVQRIHLPFAGAPVEILQGFLGNFSHNGNDAFAVDFALPEGTPLTAVRSGIVKRLRFDSNQGCDEERCRDDGNYIEIDHGDGTIAQYWHLKHQGVAVKAGQTVCEGQLIGYSGNTGFSTEPHLHLAIRNLLGLSQPLLLDEYKTVSGGLPLAHTPVLASARAPSKCDEVAPSSCPELLFAHMGVVLDPGLPCSMVHRDRNYRYSGRVLGEAGRVRVSIKERESWRNTCSPTDRNGRFEIVINWEARSNDNRSYLMIAKARNTDECRAIQGWDDSPRISFYGVPNDNRQKAAVLGVLGGSDVLKDLSAETISGILEASPEGSGVLKDLSTETVSGAPEAAPEGSPEPAPPQSDK